MGWWKLNAKGELQYERTDPDKITEMAPDKLKVFGVELWSRYGQVREVIAMLKAVHDLHETDRETLRLIKSIYWDSQHCNMRVELREKLPSGWGQPEVNELGYLLISHGCPGLISIGDFRDVERYEALS
jgi:hypothetical protein